MVISKRRTDRRKKCAECGERIRKNDLINENWAGELRHANCIEVKNYEKGRSRHGE